MTVKRIHFLIGLIGTKAEIEALSSFAEGTRFARAKDTDEIGTPDGAGGWTWVSTGGGWDGDIIDIDVGSSADIGEELADNDQWIVYNTSGSAWVRATMQRLRRIVWRFTDTASDNFASNPQDDWSPSGFSGYKQLLYVIPPSDGAVLNGLLPGASGQLLGIVNSHATRKFVLADEAGSSTAAYRFSLGADVTINPGEAAFLYYDFTASRWKGIGRLLALDLTTDPEMNGTAAPGTAVTASPSDHIHPTDTSRAAAVNGVTNGDSHDHSGGDGAQISYPTLSNLPASVTNANDIFRCSSPGGDSSFVGTIATLPGGAVLTYNVTSGQEGAMVPASTSQLGKMRLWNTTRGTYGLISNCVVGTNTVTLTANVPAGWQVGDTITIASQTVVGGSIPWTDIEITSGELLNKSNVFVLLLLSSATVVSNNIQLHPFEAYASAKVKAILMQSASIPNSGLQLVNLTSNVLALAWQGTPTFAIIRQQGYLS